MKCSGGECQNRTQEIRDEISDYETKIHEAKERYHEVLILNLKKDAVMWQLEKDFAKLKFSKYRDILGEKSIESLRVISIAPQHDSKFILTAMKGLYRDDLSLLKTTTYSGRTKEKMPKEKIDILKNLFNERLESQSDFVVRNLNFGKHVKTAIENINSTSNRP